jgi:hypothetical protein
VSAAALVAWWSQFLPFPWNALVGTLGILGVLVWLHDLASMADDT